MGCTLFVLRFREGEPESLDQALVRDVLAPYIVRASEDLRNGVLIRTPEGCEVEVDVTDLCVAVSCFPPGRFFDILAGLIDRLDAIVIFSYGPPVIRREEDRAHLAEDMREAAVVVATEGPALAAFPDG
ncbi:hypothetical protein ACFVQ4_17160 [Streptomyces laurentii]|uniref:hypothetical protein n=1 Tax=Streptomyces laurentii TaxID=39478 RepID=UPI0036C037CF